MIGIVGGLGGVRGRRWRRIYSAVYSAQTPGVASLGALSLVRASAAGAENDGGANVFLVDVASANQGRIAKRGSNTGLRIERATTNLWLSRDLNNAGLLAGSNDTTPYPAQTGIDGTANAFRVQCTSAGFGKGYAPTVAAGMYTHSLYAMRGSVGGIVLSTCYANSNTPASGNSEALAKANPGTAAFTRYSLAMTHLSGSDYIAQRLQFGVDTSSLTPNAGLTAGARDAVIDGVQMELGPLSSYTPSARAAERFYLPSASTWITRGRFRLGLTWTPDVSHADMLAFGLSNPVIWYLDSLNYCEVNVGRRRLRVCIGGTLTSLATQLPAWSADDSFVFRDLVFGCARPTGSYSYNGGAYTSLNDGTESELPPILVDSGQTLELFNNNGAQQLQGIIGSLTVDA